MISKEHLSRKVPEGKLYNPDLSACPQRRRLSKDLTPFSLKEVLKRINAIHVKINLAHQEVFPKQRSRLLSLYQYKRRFIDISPQGYFSLSKFVTSLVDFSFVRSLVASCYSREGGSSFDPDLCSVFIFASFWMGSGIWMILYPVCMIKTKEDPIEPMPGYPREENPL